MVQLLVSATFCWLIVLTKSSRIRLEATSTAEEHDTPRSTGWQPKLTQAPYHPRYGALSQRDLFGRQADVDVCAYINGSPDQPYTCTGTCSAYDNGYFNCCLKDSDGNVLPNCYPATSCLTPGKSNPNTASGVVVFADQTLLCPSQLPVCVTTYVYVSDASASTLSTISTFWCSASSTTIYMYQHPQGNSAFAATSTSSANTRSTASSSLSSSSSSLSPSSSSSIASTKLSSATESPASATLGASTSATPDHDGTPIGAIAGGAVGGVAALAVAAGIVWFLVRQKEQEKRSVIPEISSHNPGKFN